MESLRTTRPGQLKSLGNRRDKRRGVAKAQNISRSGGGFSNEVIKAKGLQRHGTLQTRTEKKIRARKGTRPRPGLSKDMSIGSDIKTGKV